MQSFVKGPAFSDLIEVSKKNHIKDHEDNIAWVLQNHTINQARSEVGSKRIISLHR